MLIVVLEFQDGNLVSVPALDLTAHDAKEVFRIGEFLIGSSDSSNLGGHPGIRY